MDGHVRNSRFYQQAAPYGADGAGVMGGVGVGGGAGGAGDGGRAGPNGVVARRRVSGLHGQLRSPATPIPAPGERLSGTLSGTSFPHGHPSIPALQAQLGSSITSSAASQTPLFERDGAEALRLRVREVEEELQRAHLECERLLHKLEAQAQRQRDLEDINEDLERRLEGTAQDHTDREARLLADVTRLREELEVVKREHDQERTRRQAEHQQFVRLQQDLYRMHQRKYDTPRAGPSRSGDAVRRQFMASHIKSLPVSTAGAESSPGLAPPVGAADSGRSRGGGGGSARGDTDSYVNVRRREIQRRKTTAMRSMLDFFGLA